MAPRVRRRGHPARYIDVSCTDKKALQNLTGNGRTEQRVARRARVLLAMAQPVTVVQDLAERVDMTSQGIWDLCRRYEERGVDAVRDAARSGRPRKFSPPR